MRMKERKNLKRNTHRETDKHKAGTFGIGLGSGVRGIKDLFCTFVFDNWGKKMK